MAAVVNEPVLVNESVDALTSATVDQANPPQQQESAASAAVAAMVGAAATSSTQSAQPSAASLYIGDLQPFVAEKELFEFFRPIGDVASVRVCRDSVTRRSLCYAYVNFANFADGVRALEELNYRLIAGKPCRLMWSQRDPTLRKSGAGNVFIKNLDPNINNKGLDEVFKVFGPILSCKVRLSEDGNSGYGFVHFSSKESADAAINAFDGVYFNDRKVSVCFHESRKSRENRNVVARMNFTNVYVKNLPIEVTEEELRKMFNEYGTVLSVVVAKNAENVSRGFGFINFEDHVSAEAAVECLHKTEINGNVIHVCRAQKKQEREESLRKEFENRRQEWFQKYQGSNLYVKNLDDDYDDAKLRAEFAPYGTITSCRVMMDEKSNSRGFGFVCFSCPEEASKACGEVNGRIINKKPLYVGLAQSKDNRRAQLTASYAQAEHFSQFQAMSGIAPQMLGQAPQAIYGGAPMYYAPTVPQSRPGYYGAAQQQMPMRQRWAGQQQPQSLVGAQGISGAGVGSGYYSMNPQNQQHQQQQLPQQQQQQQQQQPQQYQPNSHIGVGGGNNGGGHPMQRIQRVSRGQPHQFVGGQSMAGQAAMGVGGGQAAVRGLAGHHHHNNNHHQQQQQQQQQRMPHGGMQHQKQAGFKYTAGARNTNNLVGAVGSNAVGAAAGYAAEINSNAVAQVMMPRDMQIQHQMEQQLHLEPSQSQQQMVDANDQDNGEVPASNGVNNSKIDPAQLALMSEDSRKQHLGEALYGLIHPLEEEYAPKITGMLLDMGNAEVLELLESPEELRVKVHEAAQLLRQRANDGE